MPLATPLALEAKPVRGQVSPCPLSSHVAFINNDIQRSWGEAIDPLLAEHVTVSLNRIRNVYSVGVYMVRPRSCSLTPAWPLFVATSPAALTLNKILLLFRRTTRVTACWTATS